MKFSKQIGLILLGVAVLADLCSTQTVCSEENREEDLETCLEAIRSAIADDSLFYFGTDYEGNCPPEDENTIDCFKLVPTGSSLADILPGVEYEGIDRYLDVVYTAEPGSYDGCDTTVVVEDSGVFVLDPAADVINSSVECFSLRDAPEFEWNTTIDDDETQYTMLMMDVALGFTHIVSLNIPGSDFPGGDVIFPYVGPGNPATSSHPYVFLLFRQVFQNIILDEGWIARLILPFQLQNNIPEFMADHDLEGPLATNWVNVVGDIYSAELSRNARVSDNCAYHIGQALDIDIHDRNFFPEDFVNDVFISTDITAPPIDYEVCCDMYSNNATDLTVDAIAANSELTPCVDVRTGINMDVTFSKKKVFPSPDDFLDETHLLMIVDPDFPDSTVALPNQPIIHMMVTDIKDGVYDSGFQLHPYLGPLPPDIEPHFYYFLLYNQPEDANITTTEEYTTDCAPDFCCTFRCLFNITQFVDDFGLELIGASWWSSYNDPFVNYSYIEGGGDTDEYCAGDPDYPDCDEFKPIILY